MSKEIVKVLIADDHPLILDGLKTSMANEEGIKIVAQAKEGHEVLDQLRRHEIDVVLLDINMPGMNGFETLQEIRPRFPDTKIIILSMYDKPEFIRSLIAAGANGYLLKNTGKDEMTYAIKRVTAGDTFFSEEVSRILKHEEEMPGSAVRLTRREKEILQLISEEKTTAEIADQLFISTHTVDTHRKNLLAKLDVKNTAGLVKFAIENGITRDF